MDTIKQQKSNKYSASSQGGIILVLLCRYLILSERKNYECTGCISLLHAAVCENCTYVYEGVVLDENISSESSSTCRNQAEIVVGSVVGGTSLGLVITAFAFFCLRRREQRRKKKKDKVSHNLQNPAYEIEDDVVTQNIQDQRNKQIALYSEIKDEMLIPTKDLHANSDKKQKDICEPHLKEDGFNAYNHLYEANKINKVHLYDHATTKQASSFSGSTDEHGAMSLKTVDNISSEKDGTAVAGCDSGKQNKSAGQYYVLEKEIQSNI